MAAERGWALPTLVGVWLAHTPILDEAETCGVLLEPLDQRNGATHYHVDLNEYPQSGEPWRHSDILCRAQAALDV